MIRDLRRAVGGALLGLGLAIGTPAVAGTPCEETVASAATLQKSLALARRVLGVLDAGDHRVVLLARVGQDLSKYRLRFSHLGFVVRDHPDGRWTVVHDLNLCGTDQSGLYVQGLGNFFSDDLFAYEAAVFSLPAELQARLERMLRSTAQIKRFHEPRYSVVAYPFATRYQNSNQWALETMAAAMAPEGEVATRAEAQKWLQAAGFTPTVLNIPAMTRLGGRMFKASIAFDDHPGEYRWSDRIHVVSVDSVFAFLATRHPQETRLQVVGLE